MYNFCRYNHTMNAANALPRGCTSFKTRQLARLLSRHYDAELAKAGLKTTQYSLLSHVQRLGPLAPGELARRMGLDASTLTRNLQPLIANGWLTQEAGADARSRLVAITAAGCDKQAEAQACWKRAQQHLNGLLGLERVAALHALIDACTAQLQAGSAEAPTDEESA